MAGTHHYVTIYLLTMGCFQFGDSTHKAAIHISVQVLVSYLFLIFIFTFEF